MASFGKAGAKGAARPGPYGAGEGRALENPECQVYVGNLSYKVKWQELKDHFKQVGEVENARILTEDGTDWGRSRGVGIVRFGTEADAKAAIARLNESELDGRNILVDAWTGSSGKWKSEQGEKGKGGAFAKGKGAAFGMLMNAFGGKGCGGKGFGRPTFDVHGENLVYVGNLTYEVKWKQLKDHMKQAGNVEFCKVLTEDGTDFGRSKGVGCVRYSTDAEVQQAISMLNETELMGRNILVDRWTSGGGGGKR